MIDHNKDATKENTLDENTLGIASLAYFLFVNVSTSTFLSKASS
jgi:hypothetical protein